MFQTFLDWLKQLFSSKPKVNTLVNRSDKVLNVFVKTKNDLEKVNEDIHDEKVKLTKKVDILQGHHDMLASKAETNAKVVENINKIFN